VLATQPVVQLADAQGASVAAAGIAVTATVDAGSITGTVTAMTGADGRAVFHDLAIAAPVGRRTLTFAAPQLRVASHAIELRAGPARLVAANAPTTQSAGSGRVVAAPPSIRVTDAAGNPAAGVAVGFTVISGGGSIPGGSIATGIDGVATVASWTLGNSAGENAVRAGVTGLPDSVVFTAFGTLVAADRVLAQEGMDQIAQRLTAVPVAPAVKVVDADGRPVAGFAISFEVTQGGGTVTGADQLTDAAGIARVGSWVLGATIGTNQLVALAPGLPGSPVEFVATGRGIGRMSATAGAAQNGLPGAAVAVRPTVRVVDLSGNSLAGIPVAFSVEAGGGTVTGAAQVTSATGHATVGSWTLGPSPGENRLHATADGIEMSPVLFTASGFTVVPVRIAVHAGAGQTGPINTPLPVAPAVIVTDADGTPAPGQTVTFEAQGGTVINASAVSGADGVASSGGWTLGMGMGTHTLLARASGLQGSPVTFQATATVGSPARMVTNHQVENAVVGQVIQNVPGVYVQDVGENNLAGVQVTFTAATGTVTGAVKLTDAEGFAAPDGWVLGTTSGVQNLVATVAGLAPLPMPLNALADAVVSMEVAGGNGQTAGVRRMLPLDLVARFRDRYGNPVTGFSLAYEVPQGGQITATEHSDAEGLLRFRWRLGSIVGPNTVHGTNPDVPSLSVTFSATATEVVSDFAIELRPLGGISASHQPAFDAAVARWRDIILTDVPQWTLTSPAGSCFSGQPALNESVDDVIIYIQAVPIDGLGGVLGAAGPCVQRSGSHLPVMGLIRFDSADLDDLASHGQLSTVVLHEMAHVLGFGTIWTDRGLLSGAGTLNPTFTGAFARTAYQAIGGIGAVPVENTGGPGTADGHWRESVFTSELMTGYITNGFANPLSAVTIGSLQDLGYGVDYGTADPYGGASLRRQAVSPLRQLRELPLDGPIVVTAPDGRTVSERPRR
jgi:adhesin/invasin